MSASVADSQEDPLAALQKGQPKEVADLMDRIVGCNHWSGEEPYDAERRAQIRKAIKDLKCDLLDKDEAALKKKYAKTPKTAEAIDAAKNVAY